MSWAQGLIYLRAVRRRAGPGESPIAIRDVTLAAIRYSLARVRRASRAQVNGARDLRRRLRAAREAKPKAGSPTPERRRQGAIERVVAPKRELANDPAMVYHAPDNLERLHRNHKITDNMLHAAARFHADWIKGGLDPLRAANLMRESRATGGETLARMAARDRVRAVSDRLGGNGTVGFQALIHVVGGAMTVAAWSETERRGPWRLDPHKASGVLICALGVLEGFYRPRPQAPESGR